MANIIFPDTRNGRPLPTIQISDWLWSTRGSGIIVMITVLGLCTSLQSRMCMTHIDVTERRIDRVQFHFTYSERGHHKGYALVG